MTKQDVLNVFKNSIVMCDADGTCLLHDNDLVKTFKEYADEKEKEIEALKLQLKEVKNAK